METRLNADSSRPALRQRRSARRRSLIFGSWNNKYKVMLANNSSSSSSSFIHTIQLQYNNITTEKVCSSQRSKAFELAATTEQLKVGRGYTEFIKTNCLKLWLD